ncbi:MAG: flagellar hook capping FlgD N-terminal domain-containing protein, partial [Amphiplicatus sp.]
ELTMTMTVTDSSSAPKPAAKDNSAAATAASDFDSFLKLLTAQLRNQDPLSPLDSTQFVEQLASFSSVEQQIETNTLLKELTSGMTQSGLETATLWIGKEVQTPSETARFSGEPLSFKLPADASGEIVVRNASKEVIYRHPVESGAGDFVWSGEKTDGTSAAHGDYTVKMEKKGADGVVKTTPVESVANVTEARLIDGAIRLILDNGSIVDPASVTAVRAPKVEAEA